MRREIEFLKLTIKIQRLQIAKAQENAEKLAHRYRNDSEITKMFVFRRCLKSVADAFLENAQKVSIIFGAIRFSFI